jgi:hypothetical protein
MALLRLPLHKIAPLCTGTLVSLPFFHKDTNHVGLDLQTDDFILTQPPLKNYLQITVTL